jgi:hypothetical protein
VQIKFKDLCLNQPLIARNSHENPMQYSQQGMSSSGKKKKAEPFLPTSQLQSYMCETAEHTGEHHAPYATPLPTPTTTPGK